MIDANELLLEDTTLREGEQSPGVSFTTEEKVQIARLLDALGVNAIEVGTPAMGGPEREAIEALVRENLSVRLIGWNRGRRSDLEASLDCGLDSVHIGLPASDHHLKEKFKRDRRWVIEVVQESVGFAKSHNAWVSVSAEDVGRADLEFLIEYAKAVKEAGADRMRMSDTIGVLEPFRAYEIFNTIRRESGMTLQAHMHNDFGLATANTLAAVKGGARHIHFTVNGLGERAGIAPIDEVLMGLKYHLGVKIALETNKLTELAQFVAAASRRSIPANKAVTGSAMFAHESGIHVDGVLKVPEAFEPYPPEEVGGTRQIVIGKHSGSAALRHVLSEQDVEFDEQHIDKLLEEVRYEAVKRKEILPPTEVLKLYRSIESSAK